MSLICYECGIDLQPSDSLPGREGTIVHPIVPALIYVPLSKEIAKPDYKMAHVEAPDSRSLCFQCIENGFSQEKKEALSSVYECFEAEMSLREIEERQKGRLIPLSQLSENVKASEDLEKVFQAVRDNCLYCGEDPKATYFTAKVIDRVGSSQHLTGFGSYSWSNLKKSATRFNICFEDFMNNFPRCFEQLSYDMLEEQNPNANPGGFEFFASEEFVKAVEKETGKSIEEHLGVRAIDPKDFH